MKLPAINLRRTYLIARRDYLGYVKTWGFWLSFFMPFIFGALGFVASTWDFKVSPTRYETVLDETGLHKAALIQLDKDNKDRIATEVLRTLGKTLLPDAQSEEFETIITTQGVEAGQAYLDRKIPGAGDRLKLPEANMIFVDLPADNLEDLKAHIRDEQLISHDDKEVKLNGVIHIYDDDGVKADYWSPNFNNPEAERLAKGYFRQLATDGYLAGGNLSQEGLNTARKAAIEVNTFDPTKTDIKEGGSQKVTMTDRVPFIVAAILSGMLWLTVFSGAYMLLTSMLEEKMNKLLEMMLASTRFTEIIFGKLLGVAALTITAMLPYIILGIGAVIGFILFGDPEIAQGLKNTFSIQMVVFFIIFLILGYIFYGAFFIALGALAESMQDAQTLTTPIMLVLTACILVVPLGMNSPDSPLLVFASWFPLSAPFAAIVRLPADPPLWELCLSALFLGIISIGVIMLAERIFRYGVLSGAGVKGVTDWFKRTVLRRKTS